MMPAPSWFYRGAVMYVHDITSNGNDIFVEFMSVEIPGQLFQTALFPIGTRELNGWEPDLLNDQRGMEAEKQRMIP